MKQTKRFFSKRPKLFKGEPQNLEILQAETDIVLAVNTMKDELKQTYTLIEDVGEMKKRNEIQLKILNTLQGLATIARKSYLKVSYSYLKESEIQAQS